MTGGSQNISVHGTSSMQRYFQWVGRAWEPVGSTAKESAFLQKGEKRYTLSLIDSLGFGKQKQKEDNKNPY